MTQAEATQTTTTHDLDERLDQHRVELTAYCYRMLGSAFEAEDAVQETLVRAWRGFDRFEGRAALRSWLYRIATNVCLDMLGGRERRARPMDFGGPGAPDLEHLGSELQRRRGCSRSPTAASFPRRATLPSSPALARRFVSPSSPRSSTCRRSSARCSSCAKCCAGRHPRSPSSSTRSVASVNSALQRARATLDDAAPQPTDQLEPMDAEQRELLGRYVDAFERYDMDSLVALLHEDATLSMPPYALWLRGHADFREWLLGPGHGCRGSRLVPVAANGAPAFGQYRPSGPGGAYEPFALQVLEISEGRIVSFNAFLDTDRLFPLFGLGSTP